MSKMRKNIPSDLKQTVRYQALLILLNVRHQQAYSNLMIKQANVHDKDKNLLAELVYGTISRRYYLEYQLADAIKGKKVDDWVKELLLLSLYQLFFLDHVPDHAVLNEAVTLAKACGNIGIAKFVNGVLRHIQRRGVIDIKAKSDLERLSLETSMPIWLLELLEEQYGFTTTQEVAYSQLQPSKVSARVTSNQYSRDEIIAQLINEGFDVKESEISPYGIVGEKGFLAASTPFIHGDITMQDESSMLVAPSLQLEPSSQVLDACAAPGGKTTHIASYLDANQGGKVTALDIHQHKCRLIEDNVARQHLSDVVETKVLDARCVQDIFSNEQFDRILVDAPCSGLGLIRRKPDIKYTKQRDDLHQLTHIQLDILNACAPLLKKDGLLVYSTCTINKEENEEVVEQFLDQHSMFEVVDIFGSQAVEKSIHQRMLTLLPSDYLTDGFFICCLKRKS